MVHTVETDLPRKGVIHANRELYGAQLQAPRRAPCERNDVLLRGALRRRDACTARKDLGGKSMSRKYLI